jgi:hypothetical protein
MIARVKWVQTGYTVVNLCIAAAALLCFLETSRFHSRLSDHGAPFMVTALFFLIPLAAVVLWVLNRPCRIAHSRPQRAYLIVSRVVWFGTWLFSCLPVVLWVAVTQPWPLTLRHGPDTNYSRQGFSRHMGFPPPASVSGIYYRADEGWLDSAYHLRFTCQDRDLVTQVVARLQLQETNKATMGLLSKSPDWWDEKARRKGLRAFAREPGGYYWYLWYDPVTGTVWYEEFST